MGYNISKTNLKPLFVLDLMKKQAQLPSIHEIAGMDGIELEEIAKNTEDLIFQINSQSQTDKLLEHPLRELLGLDKQLRTIRGSLKVEVAKQLPHSRLLGWPSGYLLKCYYQARAVVVVPRHQEVVSHLLKMREV